MQKEVIKKSIDVPEDLFARIMNFSHKRKIYKFSPAVISLLEAALDREEEGCDGGN